MTVDRLVRAWGVAPVQPTRADIEQWLLTAGHESDAVGHLQALGITVRGIDNNQWSVSGGRLAAELRLNSDELKTTAVRVLIDAWNRAASQDSD